MAQNPPYAQYPYYAQPQNIYQQLGKPQPQPHLQPIYQQHPQQPPPQPQQQQQYQYVYSQQQPQQSQALQRVPSAVGFQQPYPQQQVAQPQMYPYTHTPAPNIGPLPTQTPAPASMYQQQQQSRPTSQNSRIPTSSFPFTPPGQQSSGMVPQQITHNPSQNQGQLVPVSQANTMRGPSPAVSPRPPIAPSAILAQQVQQQQPPSMALVPANRSSTVAAPQRQIMPPPPPQHPQAQRQPQPQPQPQSRPVSQSYSQPQQPQSFPMKQLQLQGNQPPQTPAQTTSQRRPLPSPGASRPFTAAPPKHPATINTNSTLTRTPGNSQPPSPVKPFSRNSTAPTSPTKINTPSSPTKNITPSSPTKPNATPASPTKSRPLPTPGGGGANISASNLAKEGFAGVGAAGNTRVSGLPIPSTVSSLMAGVIPPDMLNATDPDASIEDEEEAYGGIETSATGSPIKTTFNQPPISRRASPPRFIPGSGGTTTLISSSPTKEIPGRENVFGRGLSTTLSNVVSTSNNTASSIRSQPQPQSQMQSQPQHKPNSSILANPPSTINQRYSSNNISQAGGTTIATAKPSQPQTQAQAQSQSQALVQTHNRSQSQQQDQTSTSTKKFTPMWRRTIPDYPQPAFGYAAGMVPEPFTGTNKPPVTAITATSPQSPGKTPLTEMEKQRALVERQHIERQLNAAMVKVHTQNKAQANNDMPVSNTSYSAYALYSRSNPNLNQQVANSSHIRSGAQVYDDDEDEDEEDTSEETEEEEEEEKEETDETDEGVRRKKHRKKVSGTSGGKKKVSKEKERKVAKKVKLGSKSTSASKKRSSRKDLTSTSEDDDVETTEVSAEEETEEDHHRRSRHVKSSSVSSSKFKTKVEKEKEAIRKRRASQPFDEDYEDVPRKRDPSTRRRESPPRPTSYHERGMSSSSAFARRASPSPPLVDDRYSYGRRASPSPPPVRASRRVSPPRVSLLKDAQRRTVKLRGYEDEEIDERGRRDEMGHRMKVDQCRSRERNRNEDYDDMDRNRDYFPPQPNKRYSTNRSQSRPRDRGVDVDEYEYEKICQEERDMQYGVARTNPVNIPSRKHDEREDWTRGNRRDERELNNNKVFNIGRRESPPRAYTNTRDSGYSAGGYRSRPASPTRTYSQQSTQPAPLQSPYRSRPSSPTGAHERGLVTKFSAVNVNDRGVHDNRNGGGRSADDWPVDIPRLPRTPGQTSNHGSQLDSNHGQRNNRDAYTTHDGRTSNMSGRSSAMTDYGSTSGHNNTSIARPLRREVPEPRRHQNLGMNLDDPPPRSVSPALSQGSTVYERHNYQQQQQQSQPQPQTFNRRPQSEMYSNTPPSHTIQREKSMYDDMSNDPIPVAAIRKRSQSQVYDPPSPVPRPPSIHPLERANMNKTKINNGTPKIQTIDIESPAPVGGRDKRADLDKMLSDPEDDDDDRMPRIINAGFGGNNRNGRRNQSGVPDIHVDETRSPTIHVDSPTQQLDSPRGPSIQIDSPRGPMIQVDSPRGPVINVDSPRGPTINIEPVSTGNTPRVQVYEVPGISVAGPEFEEHNGQHGQHSHGSRPPVVQAQRRQGGPRPRGGLICGGCDGPIVGRIVSAMDARWHPQCFKCDVCGDFLEHVSSYEHEGKPYCHLDYHENFAPRCFSCKTAIIEERFISLDDPALGKRTYHEQHFFCAECGDPFLAPSMNSTTRTGELSVSGDGEFESDDVGFTVYKGHPYCEACHVRLRLPKCKKCKKSIRDHEQAVEALGGKWCWSCFVCAGCENPFENPSFFQRGDKPFCERCFDIMLRNEV